MIPKEFSPLSNISKTIRIRADYATTDNFVGEIIDGYNSKNLVILNKVYEALKLAEKRFNDKGMSIVVYDSYRPVKAVEHFQRWAQTDCIKMKDKFYPDLTKAEVFAEGFIAKRSSHSRGIAIDMGLYSLEDGNELDFGTIFDFFHHSSYTASNLVCSNARSNRLLMKEIMVQCGFSNFYKEWWHFSYSDSIEDEIFWNFDII